MHASTGDLRSGESKKSPDADKKRKLPPIIKMYWFQFFGSMVISFGRISLFYELYGDATATRGTLAYQRFMDGVRFGTKTLLIDGKPRSLRKPPTKNP